MKKIMLKALGAWFVLAISIPGYSQELASDLAFANKGPVIKNVETENPVRHLYHTEVRPRALRDFAIKYKKVPDEKWFRIPDGFLAEFTVDDIKYRVDYDKEGYWLGTMRIYHENKLPEEVRDLVRRAYYDYAITLVQEIESHRKRNDGIFNSITYVIHLEGKTRLINLIVREDEVTEWQSIQK